MVVELMILCRKNLVHDHMDHFVKEAHPSIGLSVCLLPSCACDCDCGHALLCSFPPSAAAAATFCMPSFAVTRI